MNQCRVVIYGHRARRLYMRAFDISFNGGIIVAQDVRQEVYMFYERANGLIAAVAILALLAVLVLSTSAPAICDGCDGQVFDYISQGEHTSYRCKSDCGGTTWHEEVHYKDHHYGPGSEPGCKIWVDVAYDVRDCRGCPPLGMWRDNIIRMQIENCCVCISPDP